MTYDNADEVKVMARRHGFQMRLIPMSNTHHATVEELVIGRDLSWMDSYLEAHEPVVIFEAKEKMKEQKKQSSRINASHKKQAHSKVTSEEC